MKWYWKLMVLIAVGTLVFCIAGMVYVVKAKYQMNEYVLQLGAAFNAATIVNAEETHLEEDKAVIAEYEGRRVIISPDNYKALQSYLRRHYATPPFARVKKDEALHIVFCGHTHLYAVPDKDGQGALLLLETGEKDYTMHIASTDLWQRIRDISMDGRAQYPNIPL